MDIPKRIQAQDAETFQRGLQEAAARHSAAIAAGLKQGEGAEAPLTPEALQERMDSIQLNLPDDKPEIELDASFFQEDIRNALDSITVQLRGMRRDPKVTKAEIQEVKGHRARLSGLLSRTIQKGLQEQDLKLGNELLQQYTAFVVKTMNS